MTATDDEGETASAAVTVTVTVAGTPTVTAVTSSRADRWLPGGAVVLTADGGPILTAAS